MDASCPAKANLIVQHNFEGDANILDATIERRIEVRKALTALAQDLQRIQGSPTQIQAEIKLQIGGNAPKEHSYKITVSDHDFDATEFLGIAAGGSGSIGVASSLPTAVRSDGQQARPGRPEVHRAEIDDAVVEINPFKRQKTGGDKTSTPIFQQQAPAPLAQMVQLPMPSGPDDTLAFLRTWHDGWTRQGGWLFDTLTKSYTTVNGLRGSLEKSMESVQDVIGQSINASSAGTINELASVTKLIHWLEHCRKTSADKVQEREEKWRSSSATFHDLARREREAAEKRIERKLDEQNELLMKLACINNIDVVGEPGQQSGGSDERSREASLGAQLTSELNDEAGRHGDTEKKPFSVDH